MLETLLELRQCFNLVVSEGKHFGYGLTGRQRNIKYGNEDLEAKQRQAQLKPPSLDDEIDVCEVAFKCVEKKMPMIMAQLEHLGVGTEFGFIDIFVNIYI